MKDLSIAELADRISSLLLDTLKKDRYRIELQKGSKARITGVQDGELFFGVTCKVFKLPPPEPPKKPDPDPEPNERRVEESNP